MTRTRLMKPFVGPLERLLYSRKFLIMVCDIVIPSIVLYFVGKYGSASLYDDIKFLILALQPVVLAVIVAIAWEDVSEKRSTIKRE